MNTKIVTTQKMKFCIKDFFNKCDQILSCSHLLKISLMENFIFLRSVSRLNERKKILLILSCIELPLLESRLKKKFPVKKSV